MYEVHYTGVGYHYVTDHVHKFPDTGLLKSWCKGCGAQAIWNRETLRYEAQDESTQSILISNNPSANIVY